MRRILFYAWASPATVLGLLFAPLALATRGHVDVVDGVLEVSGGFVRRFLTSPLVGSQGASAMTLGHVVLGRDRACLARSRRHEHVHVAQYERWGPLMIPLYLLASLSARLAGKHPYFDNYFEREAFARDGGVQR